MKQVPLTQPGDVHGRLTVLAVHAGARRILRTADCVCVCGNRCTVATADLRKGHTRSCGCLRKEVNKEACRVAEPLKKSRAYHVLRNAIDRCHNPKSKSYQNYGGRGIAVCDEWRNDSRAFLRDMGEPPPGMSLDRIDNDKGYCKENCRWATWKQQALNKRNTVKATLNGEVKPLMVWCDEFGADYQLARKRLSDGWAIERVLALTQKNPAPSLPVKEQA